MGRHIGAFAPPAALAIVFPGFQRRGRSNASLGKRLAPMRRHTGGDMHFANKTLLSLTLSLLASVASAATITGTVTGPDGKPFMGAFVVAENPQTKMTVSVLS